MNVIKRNSVNGFPVVMDQFFKDILGGTQVNHTAIPPVNIIETDNAFSLELMAPGLKKEQFAIDIENELITIAYAEATENTEAETGKYTRREFRSAAFNRSFKLPDNIKTEEITAEYQDGILNVTLPKKEETLPLKRSVTIL